MLTRLAVKRPVSTLVLSLLLSGLGLLSLRRLPVSLLPPAERPRIVVTLKRSALTPELMLSRVTRDAERLCSGLPSVDRVSSRTGAGLATLMLVGRWQGDPDRMRLEVEEALSRLDSKIDRSVSLLSGDLLATMEIAVTGGSIANRTRFLRDVAIPGLARASGAGRVSLLGLHERKVVVRPRPEALYARKLSVFDLLSAMKQFGGVQEVGMVRVGAETIPLAISSRIRSLDALAEARVPCVGGFARLLDLADIQRIEDPGESTVLVDGEKGALILVFRAPQANAVRLSRGIRARLPGLAERAPPGIGLVVVSDRSQAVSAALVSLAAAGLLGVVLLGVALLVFLRSFVAALGVGVLVPVSILTCFVFFYLFGVPLDIVSLTGLALAAGMLVDGAIVVLEAVYAAGRRGPEGRIAGTRRVATAVVAGGVTTVVAMVPLLYLKGLARAMLGEQAFAIASAVAVSIFFSLTLAPILSRPGSAPREVPGAARYVRWLDRRLRSPWPALLLLLLLLGGALLSGLFLPQHLLPRTKSRAVWVRFEMEPDLAKRTEDAIFHEIDERVRAAALKIEASVLAIRGEVEPGGIASNRGVLVVTAGSRPVPVSLLQDAVSGVAGVRFVVEAEPDPLLAGIVRQGMGVTVSVDSEGQVGPAMESVGRQLASSLGSGYRPEGAGDARPILRVRYDVARLAALGEDPDSVGKQVSAALGQVEAGRVEIEGLADSIELLPLAVSNPLLVPIRLGSDENAVMAPLAALATVRRDSRQAWIDRRDGRFAADLRLPGFKGRDLRKLSRALARLELPPFVRASPSGSALEASRSFHEILLAIVLSVVMVYLAIAAFYESFTLPLLIMSTVPAGIGGALLLLFLCGESLNVMSFMGILFLSGIVVNNAIVLVDRIEGQEIAKAGLRRAIVAAVKERLRPIFMTTATTALGILPMAFVGGEGAELRRPVAIAILGGILTSTVASLLLVPLLRMVGGGKRNR